MKLAKKTINSIDVEKRLAIARHKNRPKGRDVIDSLTDVFEQIHGDQLYGDDLSVISGFGRIENYRCLWIAQHKGIDLTEKKNCNYGMNKPEGFRKALRLMKLAEKFSLPIITILDTPGALPYLEAEKRGQSSAIANNLFYLSDIATPVVSIILGEGASGGALGLGIADKILMLEHAYFSVINPEGCASILWKDTQKLKVAAEALSMQSENLLECDVIDDIIFEGKGGFHENQEEVYTLIKKKLLHSLSFLCDLSKESLIEKRRKKYRSF